MPAMCCQAQVLHAWRRSAARVPRQRSDARALVGAHLYLCGARAGTRTAWRRPSDAPARRGAGSERPLQPRARLPRCCTSACCGRARCLGASCARSRAARPGCACRVCSVSAHGLGFWQCARAPSRAHACTKCSFVGFGGSGRAGGCCACHTRCAARTHAHRRGAPSGRAACANPLGVCLLENPPWCAVAGLGVNSLGPVARPRCPVKAP